MKIQHKKVRYSVKVRKLNSDSNYDTAISIHRIGERSPVWGTVIKSSDNIRQTAKAVIKTLA